MLRSALMGLILTFAVSAGAEDFDYNYFAVGYGTVDFDEIDVDGDGIGISGSFEFADTFHAFAQYEVADLDFNVDATEWNLGVGYHTELSEKIGAFANLSYEYVKVDAPGFGSADDNGFGLGVGLRITATPKLEVETGLKYIDLSDSGDDTAFGLGGLYSFTDVFAVDVEGSWTDDVSSCLLTGRFYFDQ